MFMNSSTTTSKQQEQIQKLYKEQTKNLVIALYISCLLVIGSSVLGAVSSYNLLNDYSYYNPVQITNIVFSSLVFVVVLCSTYAIISPKVQKCGKIMSSIFFFIAVSASMGILLASVLLSTGEVICGYYIGHDQPVDGMYIKISLEVSYPSCSVMESTPGLTLKQVLQVYSIVIIDKYCEGDLSCASYDSLIVGEWSSMFTLQLTALISIVVLFFVYVAVIVLMQNKFKRIEDGVKKGQYLLQNDQFAQQFQGQNTYQYQPYPNEQKINSQQPQGFNQIGSINQNQLVSQQTNPQFVPQQANNQQYIINNNQRIDVGQPIYN